MKIEDELKFLPLTSDIVKTKTTIEFSAKNPIRITRLLSKFFCVMLLLHRAVSLMIAPILSTFTDIPSKFLYSHFLHTHYDHIEPHPHLTTLSRPHRTSALVCGRRRPTAQPALADASLLAKFSVLYSAIARSTSTCTASSAPFPKF